ncbi:site-specific integrase [Acetatifactor muris]|nr:site-specific integrase [Acetatifactor muris]MCR2050847.1 site-specific integrase [Acetatifactor muris]
MKEMKRKELLEKHPYKIWQGRDGKWYTYIPDEKKGRIQRERYSRAEIESLIIDYWKTQMENPTIREVFSEWNDRRLELKKISNATHLRNCQIFNRHYGEFGDRKIKAVTEEDFCEFLEEQIADKDLTAKAFSNLKTVTRGLLKRAKKRKLISFNVEELFQELDTSETDFRKVIKEDYQEVFSEEEMPVMVNYLKENLDAKNIGILLMFATGIRVGELVALKHDVFDGNTFKIRRTETRYMGEDGKYAYAVKEFPKSEAGVRTVVIPDDYAWLCSRIKMLNPFGEYVFVDKAGKRMTTNCIRRRLEKNCLKIGIYKKSPHKIRKTYGTILLDHNVDNRFIMEQMGHTDIMCTENHYHRNRRSIDAKTQIISNIPEFQAK